MEDIWIPKILLLEYFLSAKYTGFPKEILVFGGAGT